MLGRGLRNDPTAETSAHREANFGTPLEQGLPFNHVSELNRTNAQLVDGVLELLELLVDQVHDVLLALGCVYEVLVVLILAEVKFIMEQVGFDVPGHAQHRLILQSLDRLALLWLIALKLIKEVDMELGPSRDFVVQSVAFLLKHLRVLVALGQMRRCEADHVELDWQTGPFTLTHSFDNLGYIIDDSSREHVQHVKAIDGVSDCVVVRGLARQALLHLKSNTFQEGHQGVDVDGN